MENIVMDNLVLYCVVGLILTIILFFLILRMSKPKNQIIKKSTKYSGEFKNISINSNLMEKKPSDIGGIVNRNIENKNNNNNNNNVSPVSWGVTESYEKDIQRDVVLNTVKDAPIKVEEKLTLVSNNIEQTNSYQFLEEDIDLENQQRNNRPLILLVDDSMTILKFTSNILGKNGYDVITKADGEDALNYLYTRGNLKPDLILSDIEMPKMNGIELIQKIREDCKFNKTPIIIISSHAQSHLSLMTDGLIQGFMHKPFKDFELLEQVKYVLDK